MSKTYFKWASLIRLLSSADTFWYLSRGFRSGFLQWFQLTLDVLNLIVMCWIRMWTNMKKFQVEFESFHVELDFPCVEIESIHDEFECSVCWIWLAKGIVLQVLQNFMVSTWTTGHKRTEPKRLPVETKGSPFSVFFGIVRLFSLKGPPSIF